MPLYNTQKGRGEFLAPTDIWLRKRRSESLVFRAEHRWQYSVRHFLIGIQDRNAALCRLDLYYVKFVRAILCRVPIRTGLPSSSSAVSFCTLFGYGGPPAESFLFCPMAQLSHTNNISLRIEKKHGLDLFKNVPKSPGILADIKKILPKR